LHVGGANFVQNVMRGGNGGIKRLIHRYKNRDAEKKRRRKRRKPAKFAAEFMAIGAKSAVFRCAAGGRRRKIAWGLPSGFPRAGVFGERARLQCEAGANKGRAVGGKNSLSLTNSRPAALKPR
jgi:hypothetical protein